MTALVALIPAFAQAPPATEPARVVVVLDAAHGGDDLGARLGNQSEKDLALALSVKLRSLLAARSIAVVTTRESGAGVDPDRRLEIANRANAAACLNLHAALASAKGGPAVHLYVSGLPPARDVRFVPWRMAQTAWIMRSMALEGELDSALAHAGIPVTMGRAALPAIDGMACPAVAVEFAPQSHAVSEDAADADIVDFEAHVADALVAALVEWRSEGGDRRP